MRFDKYAFGKRLDELLRSSGRTARDLAKLLDVSEGKISGWRTGNSNNSPSTRELILMANYFGITTIDNLIFGAEATMTVRPSRYVEATHNGITWSWYIPNDLSERNHTEIRLGIELFEFIVRSSMSAEDTIFHIEHEHSTFRKYGWHPLRHAAKAAFRSGCLRIVNIRSNDKLANDLRKKYSLKRVLIADVSPSIVLSQFRAEFVAFMTAKHILANTDFKPHTVGIGSGYTIQRAFEIGIPTVTQFKGTQWIPLMAFEDDHKPKTANFIVGLLTNKHAGSTTTFAKHVLSNQLESKFLINNGEIQHTFITANGGKRPATARVSRTRNIQTRTADYETLYGTHYRDLWQDGTLCAEILGHWLDNKGNSIQPRSANITSVSLDVLRSNADMNFVWLLAARGYKKEATKLALEHRYASALVTDREIANYLDDSNLG